MFKKYPALNWLWFFPATAMVTIIIEALRFNYIKVEDEALILGCNFWAGLIVIGVVWGVGKIRKMIKQSMAIKLRR